MNTEPVMGSVFFYKIRQDKKHIELHLKSQ